MKLKIASLALLLSLANFAQGQVKFRVNNLDADSLAALIPDKEGTARIDAVNQLSNAICLKNLDSSMHLAEAAIALSEPEDYKKGLANGYFNLGNAWFLSDSLEPTISNYLKAYRIFEDLPPSQEFGILCMHLAIIVLYTGREEVSLKYASQAKTIYEQAGDKSGLAMAYFLMGRLTTASEEWDSSEYYFNKAFSYTDIAVNQDHAAWIHIGLENLYYAEFIKFNDTSYLVSCISEWQKALTLTGMNAANKVLIHIGIAIDYLEFSTQGSTIAAERHLDTALAITDSCKPVLDYKDQIYVWQARIFNRKGDFHKAIYLCRQGIIINDENLADFSIQDFPNPITALNYRFLLKLYKRIIYDCLYESYSKLGDHKTAHEFYVLTRQAEEAIFLEKNRNLVTMMEALSKDEKTKSRIDLLARDNELKALAIRQSRTLLFGVAGMFLVVLLFGILFVRQNKMKNEHKTVLLEQKLLRLQMNPHFIFNAFSNILRLIDTNDNKRASAYLTTFGKLLRTTLESTREDMVPFEREVDTLRNYLELQKLRYPDKFEYSLEVDDNIDQDDMSIPPMLVQPFIENAIEHGIRHKKTPGRIDVRFLLKGRTIVCEVEDDGVGREKAWEAEVNERAGHKSLATDIIRDRINTLNKKFKQKIRLEIIDKVSEGSGAMGTKVVLDLPYGSVYG